MDNTIEKASLCALGKIFGFSPKTGLAILSHLGCAEKLFRMSQDEIDELIGPYSRYRDEITPKALESAIRELSDLKKRGIEYVGYTDEDYPGLLKECEDAPIGIYIRSYNPASSLWKQDKNIAIVGTRDISSYGNEWCYRIVKTLAESGTRPLIVSGLAIGTDIAAHNAALEFGLPTIAVMATGPESVYPYRHASIADRIARTPDCALITDYPPGTAPLAIHFLRRNRIIAGLSQATLLIESKIRGGGMMTCRLAFSYGRDVYALPGRIDDLRSQGCNLLIREKIAEPITSERELLKSLGLGASSSQKKHSDLTTLDALYSTSISRDKIDQMAQILLSIKKYRGITIEEIAEKTRLEYSRTAELVRILETDGFICTDLLQRCTINFRNNV